MLKASVEASSNIITQDRLDAKPTTKPHRGTITAVTPPLPQLFARLAIHSHWVLPLQPSGAAASEYVCRLEACRSRPCELSLWRAAMRGARHCGHGPCLAPLQVGQQPMQITAARGHLDRLEAGLGMPCSGCACETDGFISGAYLA